MPVRLTQMISIWTLMMGCSAGLALSLCGCQGGTAPPPTGDGPVSFATQIQPIFTDRCTGCHSSGGAADLAGIALMLTEGSSYDLAVNVASVQDTDLTLITPGDSAASLLYLKISSDTPPVGSRMPVDGSGPLPAASIELIRTWIDEGALDN